MRKVPLFILVSLVSLLTIAQNTTVSIVRLTMEPLDQAARNYPKTDGDGNLYSIIKVRPKVDDMKFSFGLMKCIPDPVSHENETWLYVQKNARRISISGNGYNPLMNVDLGLTLESGATYILELSIGNPSLKKQDDLSAFKYIVFKVEVPDAIVKVGGKSLSVKDGGAMTKLQNGKYDYTVSAPMHEDVVGKVTIDDSQSKFEIPVSMIPTFKQVTMTVSDNAEIWIDGERKGTGLWTGDLDYSTYSVECKKDGYNTSVRAVTVSKDGPAHFELTPPEPKYGAIDVEISPIDADIYVDGRKVGTTPMTVKDLLEGSHTILVSKNGYLPFETSVFVRENGISSVESSLEKRSKGRVSVDSSPSGAELYVDDRYVGHTPYSADLLFGNHSLTVKKSGYFSESKDVSVDGKRNDILLKMKKIKQPLFNDTELYCALMLEPVPIFLIGATFGFYLANINMECSLAGGSDCLSLDCRLGYGFIVGNSFRFTPQIGYCYSGYKSSNSTSYMYNYKYNNESTMPLALRLECALNKYISIYASPEYPLLLSAVDNSSAGNKFHLRCGLKLFL